MVNAGVDRLADENVNHGLAKTSRHVGDAEFGSLTGFDLGLRNLNVTSNRSL